MQNNEWIENYQKVRNQIIAKATSLGGGVVIFFTFIFQKVIQKTYPGELSPSETSLIVLFVLTLVFSTVLYYDWAMTISRTYRDEGIHKKSSGASAAEMAIFYGKMDRCFKNIVRSISMAAILLSVIIYIALAHAYSFSIAIVFMGLYLIAVLMTFPNICKTQARKKTFVYRYHADMTMKEIEELKYEIAMIFRGKALHPITRKIENTTLSNNIAKAKKKLIFWMSTFVFIYVVVSFMYISSYSDNIMVLNGYQVSLNNYYLSVLLFILFFLLVQRYLYAQVTSGDAIMRRKICRTILKDGKKKNIESYGYTNSTTCLSCKAA